MIATKQKRHTAKASSPTSTSVHSLDDLWMGQPMSYWLEVISRKDIGKLWKRLRVSARGAKPHTGSVLLASGIISAGEIPVDVTAYITRGGFVLRFTENDIYTSNGAKDERPVGNRQDRQD